MLVTSMQTNFSIQEYMCVRCCSLASLIELLCIGYCCGYYSQLITATINFSPNKTRGIDGYCCVCICHSLGHIPHCGHIPAAPFLHLCPRWRFLAGSSASSSFSSARAAIELLVAAGISAAGSSPPHHHIPTSAFPMEFRSSSDHH
jgi:hypothetical protein